MLGSPAQDDTPQTLTEVSPAAPPDRPAAPAFVVLAVLCAVTLGLAFRGGASGPAGWLPFLIGVAAVAVVLSLGGPAVSAGRLHKVMLALFAAQVAWTALSLSWATSRASAWGELDRTLLYAVVLVLTFAAVRWAGAFGLRALVALVTGAIGVLVLVIVVHLATTGSPGGLFVLDGRLSYPITYYNALACLLMVGFWLAMGLAGGVRLPRAARGGPPGGAVPTGGDSFPRWAQPLLLTLAVMAAEVALLTQSRGALWNFLMLVPCFVILSPHRFRALANLAIVALPVALFWGRLNGVYVAVRDQAAVEPALSGALHAVGWSVLIVAGAWAVTWLVERRTGSLPRRVTFWIGIALVVLLAAGVAGGLIYADRRTEGLGGYLEERWTELTSDEAPDDEDTAASGHSA